MRILFAGVLLLVGSLAFGEDRIPFRKVICHPSDGLTGWSYLKSNVVRGGVRSPVGQIFLQFASGRSSNGAITSTNIAFPVQQLRWNSDSSAVFAWTSDKTWVLCGEQHWWGQRKYTARCWVEGKVVPNGYMPSECGDERSFVFEGEFVVGR